MKKITYLLLSVMCVMLIACSQEELQVGQLADEQGKASKATGPVFKVYPTGVDDTENLVQAFADAKAAGAGSTVELSEGEFHIGYILVKDFVGSFTGAGMGTTIIKPIPDLSFDDMQNAQLQAELLKFLRGNVRVSNMSFLNLASEASPAAVLWALLGLHDWAYNELPNLPEDHKITAVVDHVEIAGFSGPPEDPNMWVLGAGITAGPDFWWASNLPYSNADITVTNCMMHDVGYAFFSMSIETGKGEFYDNVFHDIPGMGIFLTDHLGGSTTISDNEFYDCSNGIWITNANLFLNEFKLSDGCQYEISRNEFHLKDAWGAITLGDDRKGWGIVDNENALQVLIEKNHIDMQGESWIGIWNWITDDAIIRNNTFTGHASTGIYVDPRTTNSLMLGNNFSGLECTSFVDWFPGVGGNYNILLLGKNNTVVGGGNNSTTVLNLGENNQITGAKFDNEGEMPLGQTITDNYMKWKESLRIMGKP